MLESIEAFSQLAIHNILILLYFLFFAPRKFLICNLPLLFTGFFILSSDRHSTPLCNKPSFHHFSKKKKNYHYRSLREIRHDERFSGK